MCGSFPRIKNDDRINWNSDTKNILALIRSCSKPFSGAFTFLFNENTKKKTKIRIIEAKQFKVFQKFYAVPGQVCFLKDSNPIIATKNGMIELLNYSDEKIINTKIKHLISKSLRNRLV